MVSSGDVEQWLDEHDISIIRVDATGPEGVLVGKHVSRAKFVGCLPDGVAMTDIGIVMDLAGTPQLGWWADWRRDALGDINIRPDLTTLAMMPAEPGVAWCLATLTSIDGEDLPVCPRSMLIAQTRALAAAGFDAKAAFELEFFLFEGRIDTARRGGFRNLTPLGGSSPKQGYMTQRSSEFLPFLRQLTDALESAGIPWEAFTDEAAPGQFELNLAPADAVTAADRVVRAKQVIRDVAYANDKCVTFMARPFNELTFGSGLHAHLSLWRDEEPAFVDDQLMRQWVAGCLATIDGATSVMTPNVNSFRRQVDFAAAPTTPTWGEDNKGTALRTVTRTGKLTRVEHRVASADANPYLVLAAFIAGGLSGIEEKLDPPSPAQGLPWGLPDDHPRLPRSLTTAAAALAADERLKTRLGHVFVEHWTETRRWEWLMFHSGGGDPDAAGATDWELRRYFEWV